MPFKNPSKTKQPESPEHAYNYVLFLLNLRFRTEGELRQKMQERGYTAEVIDHTIEALIKERLVDDDRYAVNYIESIKNYKYYGFYMAKKKMMERRLTQVMIEQKLDEFFTIEDETKIAKKFLKSVMGETPKKEFTQEDKQKLARKLQTRGFRIDVVSKLIF